MVVLEQGKNTTPSYKVKRRVARPREEWFVVEGAHEAVVTPEDFAVVQKVLSLDTRTSPGSSTVELFSGMVSCGECGTAMARKTVPKGAYIVITGRLASILLARVLSGSCRT